ncbi:MAG: SH3 domain-containing protein [Spirochaetales bacterium]|nr:SH3 domain-containing protein [Spirochaetales bacterium]
MKYFLVTILVCCLSFSVFGKDNTAYISATSGLKMRSEATLSSEVLAVIPYQEKVTVLKILNTSGSIEIQGKTAYWCKIRWSDYTGYVFGGFLELAPGLELLRELPSVWIELSKDKNGNFFIYQTGQGFMEKMFFDTDAEFHDMNFVPIDHNRYEAPLIITDEYMTGPTGYKIRKVEKKNGKYIITTGSSANDTKTWEISYYDPHIIVINDRNYYVQQGFEENFQKKDPSM